MWNASGSFILQGLISLVFTGNLNAEFGMTLNKKFSLHLPVQYNPFIYSKSNNTKFQNLTVLPGVRYWFRDVSFKYPGSEAYALRHVNMKFKVEIGRASCRERV